MRNQFTLKRFSSTQKGADKSIMPTVWHVKRFAWLREVERKVNTNEKAAAYWVPAPRNANHVIKRKHWLNYVCLSSIEPIPLAWLIIAMFLLSLLPSRLLWRISVAIKPRRHWAKESFQLISKHDFLSRLWRETQRWGKGKRRRFLYLSKMRLNTSLKILYDWVFGELPDVKRSWPMHRENSYG